MENFESKLQWKFQCIRVCPFMRLYMTCFSVGEANCHSVDDTCKVARISTSFILNIMNVCIQNCYRNCCISKPVRCLSQFRASSCSRFRCSMTFLIPSLQELLRRFLRVSIDRLFRVTSSHPFAVHDRNI